MVTPSTIPSRQPATASPYQSISTPQPKPRSPGKGKIRSRQRGPTANSGPDSMKVVVRARETRNLVVIG